MVEVGRRAAAAAVLANLESEANAAEYTGMGVAAASRYSAESPAAQLGRSYRSDCRPHIDTSLAHRLILMDLPK